MKSIFFMVLWVNVDIRYGCAIKRIYLVSVNGRVLIFCDDSNLFFCWIKGRIRKCEFLRIFKVAILLFLAPAERSNPTGPIS